MRCNAEVPWDSFTPASYKALHYSEVRFDDRLILEKVRDFFAEAGIVAAARGVDAGSGPNLYPALTMLPFCSKVTMLDISRSNVEWLSDQLKAPDESWDKFWHILAENRAYGDIGDYRSRLAHKIEVRRGDLFNLDPRSYDVGTMFFVAESMSNHPAEFTKAVRRFIGSLRHGAPFAIAFMRGSEGYTVESVDFPAVAIDDVDVKNCLHEVTATEWQITPIEMVNPFRNGYEGMMLATGRAVAS